MYKSILYADDVTITVSDIDSVKLVILLINNFSMVAGNKNTKLYNYII